MTFFSALLLLLPLLLLGTVLYTLRAGSGAGRGQIWALAALSPLLVAVCAALYTQASAARLASGMGSFAVTVQTLEERGAWRTHTLTLSAEQAACLAQARRQGVEGTLRVASAALRLDAHTQVRGDLPTPEQVGRLAVLGRLNCGLWVQANAERVQ